MFRAHFVALPLALAGCLLSSTATGETTPRTRLVILGVDHSVQLVAQDDQATSLHGRPRR